MKREAGRTLCGTVGALGVLWLAAWLTDRWIAFSSARGFLFTLVSYALLLLLLTFSMEKREEVRRMRALDKKMEKLTAKAYERYTAGGLSDSALLRMEREMQMRLVRAVDFGASYQGEIEEVYSKRNALRRICAERGLPVGKEGKA